MQRASANDAAANLRDAERFAAMMRAIRHCAKPTVARVQGHAFGGGVGLCAACDIVIASDQARFSVSEARFGILPAVIGPYLVEAVGQRQARRLALTATQLGASEAVAIGLIHQAVPLDALDAALERTLAELSRNGPNALMEIKRFSTRSANTRRRPSARHSPRRRSRACARRPKRRRGSPRSLRSGRRRGSRASNKAARAGCGAARFAARARRACSTMRDPGTPPAQPCPLISR
jgi:enoyl-CoA hydratase/carnithine racemase